MTTLTVVMSKLPHAQAIFTEGLAPQGYELRPVEVEPMIGAYRRMIRDLEFSVCEMAPATYLLALQAGIPLTAIPVFINRRFHHGDIVSRRELEIGVPRDLEGRRVAVRAYSVTTGVWTRGLLAEDYGVDIDSITWVVDDEDHVKIRLPDNVERVGDGRSLLELLATRHVDAAFTGNAGIGRAGPPRSGWATQAAPEADVVPLFEQPDVLARDWYIRTGIYPMHSVVVLRRALAEADEELPGRLYATFAEAKRRCRETDPWWLAVPRYARQAKLVGGDPVPYGLTTNAASIAALERFAHAQRLLDNPEGLELFWPSDYPDA